jgi:hypothetical protein
VEFLGEKLVSAVISDLNASPLSEAERVLFRFVEKVNRNSYDIRYQDVEDVRQAGWSDEAIYDAITVCALFNFFHRWIDATGVHPMSDEAHRIGAQRMAVTGYVHTSKPSVENAAPNKA